MTSGGGAPRDRMRIVFGITSFGWGGNEKWAATAAAGLAERGHHVSTIWDRGPAAAELARRGLEGCRARFVSDWNPLGLAELTRCLMAAHPDVVLLTRRREYMVGGQAARLAARLSRSSEGPPLVVLRLGLRRRLNDDFRTRRAFGSLADLVVVNSHAIREVLVQSPWFDWQKVRVIHNGVETSQVSADRGRLALSELGVAREAPVVVAAGRLSRQKGFDVLIEAMAAVQREFPEARLVILGTGSSMDGLRRSASRIGVNVLFAGHRDDVREIMAAADVYALSSRNEGMANTLLEAMSVGAPIVATDVSGTREAVRHEVDALVVPPGDPGAMAGGIEKLLRDRGFAYRLGASALSRAQAEFGVDRMVSELESELVKALRIRRRA